LAIAERVIALVEPAVAAAGYELVRIRMFPGTKTLQIMAERPDGTMDVEDCANLSRRLSLVLDAADPIGGEYNLEVSSPGIDRPLVKPADFERYKGHEARFELVEPIDGRKRFKGDILSLEGDQVRVAVKGGRPGEEVLVPLTKIDDSKLILTDRLIDQATKSREGAAGATKRS
jgi:ribosome maturation factor RimP